MAGEGDGTAYKASTLTMSLVAFPDLDHCRQSLSRPARMNRNIFVDHGLQAGAANALFTNVGLRFFSSQMLLAGYQIGRQEYDSDYMVPMCRECIFTFHGLWIGYGFEIAKPLNRGSGFFVNPIIWWGAEFVANRAILPDSDSRFLLNPALRPGIILGYYRKSVDVFLAVNYLYWLPKAMTTNGNALVDAETGQELKWDRELFPGRSGIGLQAGIRYTVF